MNITTDVEVRPLAPEDDSKIFDIFAATLLLGKRPERPLAQFDRYARLCLGWYLGPGRDDAAVATINREVVGYALVCTDSAAQARWVGLRTPALMATVLGRLATATLDPVSRRFYSSRARDAGALWRAGSAPPFPVHAHLNVLAGSRSGTVALCLRDHIDRRTLEANSPGWWAEVNAIEGGRERALERLGMKVIDRHPNQTLTRLIGRDVVRLTVLRVLTAPPSP